MTEVLILDESVSEGLPLVGEDRGNRTMWIGLGGIAAAGILLFAVLEANRQFNASPDVPSPTDYAAASTPRPGLVIPDPVFSNEGPQSVATPDDAKGEVEASLPPVRLTTANTQVDNAPISQRSAQPDDTAATPAPPTVPSQAGRSAAAIVYDVAVAATAAVANAEGGVKAVRATPAVAAAAVDRHNLVPQGTLIYAVLETALDSTQAGQARAMISTNVYNAAGTKILIAKGSRIFGEYRNDLTPGQNRAQVIWGRLIRPDGVTISLDSPASDQLGRAGIKGKVDTHFGERLLGALLQSTIDFGTAVASQAVTTSNGVVVALPTATQGAGSQLIQPPPAPTLKVRHGTRIAVFVSRDLDFSGVE
jgi:type IV secretion system protein VirB10